MGNVSKILAAVILANFTVNSSAADEKVLQLQEVEVNASGANQGDELDTGFTPQKAQTGTKILIKRLETPASVSVVTQELMQSRQITDIQQALQTVAGIGTSNFGRRGFDDITIRGFRASESTLIDGLAKSAGLWAKIIPYGYERIEVLKGAASVLYGQVQPGGVVNAISKRPKSFSINEAGISFGSFGHKSIQADINRPLSENGRNAIRLNTYISDANDPTDYVWSKNKWFAPSLSLGLTQNTDITFLLSHQDSSWLRQQGLPPSGTVLPNINGNIPLTRFTGEPDFGTYKVKRNAIGYELNHYISDNSRIKQNLRYEKKYGYGEFVSNRTLAKDGKTLSRQGRLQFTDNKTLAIDTNFNTLFNTGNISHNILVGLDFKKSDTDFSNINCQVPSIDVFNPVYGQPHKCDNKPLTYAPQKLKSTALYIQNQIKLNDDLSFLLGARYEKSNIKTDDKVRNIKRTQKDSDKTFFGGVVYKFAPQWSAYASYSESFLPNVGIGANGMPFVPERGNQIEAGLKHDGKNTSASLAIFELTRQNISTADIDNQGYQVQVGEQRARGLEAEFGLNFNDLKLTAAYTYTQTKVTKDNTLPIGVPINLTPRNIFSIWVNKKVMPELTIGAGLRYSSRQKGNFSFTLPAYALVDASASYTGKNWRATFGIKNVFNKRYYDGAVTSGVISPGMPRSFMLTANYFF